MSFEEKKHILIIDDDDRIRSLLKRYLEKHDCVVMTANGAGEAVGLLKEFVFDILIVDVMMPGQSGFEFGRDLRETSDIPIIFLTAKTELSDKAEGFDIGADDYISKPFEPEELLMRIEAILKRRGLNIQKSDIVKIGKWEFDRKLADITCGDETLRLTDVEKKLLETFLSQPNQIFSRIKLAEHLGVEGNDRTIDVQVTRLRKKIEEDPKQPRLLQTVRGKGYILHE